MATATEKGLVFDISLELENLKREAEQACNILSGIGKNAQQQGKVMDDAFTRMQDSVTTKVKHIGAAMAGMFAAGQLKGFASRVIEVRGAFQQLSVAFTTMLGDKAKADQLLQEAAEFAAKTPFELSDVAGGTKQLLAYGTAAEDVIGDIEMLGNVASGLSVPLNDMIYLYGTLKAQGTAYTMDIRQFAGRGVPIYQELAKVMGVSVKEVNELVSAGKVGFPQVQQAFRNMTSEGGQFYNLMREQSKTITGQISNLQDQISGMFNEIGASSEGVINAGLEGVSFLLEHYEEIGKSLVALIALYGEYKASLIAVSAYQKAMTATKHTEEAASLFQLLSAEQQAMISKKNLSKTSAEYYAMVSAEAQNNVKAAQAALEKARIEVKASAQTVAAKKAEYVSAQQLLSQKRAELAQITATGTQKQVEVAQRRLNAAETAKEAAAKAYLNASYDLSVKKVAVETAAKKANTVATQVNTAAQKAGAKASTLFAVVQGKLVSAFNKLKLAMLSNPFTAILLAVTALSAGLYKLVTRQTEAEKAQAKLNEAIAEAASNAAAETAQVDVLFNRLQNATKGTQEYADAKQAIIDKYGDYLDGMSEEIKSLNDVAAAYEVVKQKAQEAANRQAISSVIQVQTEIVGNKRSETYDDIEELLAKYLGEEKASEYMVKIKPIIMSGESVEGNQDFRNIGIEANHARSDLASLLNAMVGGKTALEKMEAKISELREVEAAANEAMNKAYEKFGTETAETGKTAEEEAARLVSVAEKLEEARKKLAEVNARISDIRLGKIQVEDPQAEIEGLMEQANQYKKTIEVLTGIKQGGGRKTKKSVDTDAMRAEMSRRVAEEQQRLEYEAAQAEIDTMDEGAARKLEQIKLNHAMELAELRKNKAEMLKNVQEYERKIWEAENPDWEEKGLEFKPTTTKLPKGMEDMYAGMEQSMNDKFADDVRALQEDLVEEFGSYEEKRYQLAEQWEKKIAGLPAEYQPEARKQMENELFKLDSTYNEAYKKIFGNVSKMTKAQIEEAIKLGKEMMSKISFDTNPEEFKALADAVEKLEDAQSSMMSEGWGSGWKNVILQGMELLRLQDRINEAKESGDKQLLESYKSEANIVQGNLKKGLASTGATAFANALGMAAESMQQIADIAGDTELGEKAGLISSFAQNLSAASQGAASGGWIGAIVGGVTDIFNQIITGFAQANVYAAQFNESMDDFRKNLSMMQYEIDNSRYETLFGTNSLRKAIDAYHTAMEALDRYRELVQAPMDKPQTGWLGFGVDVGDVFGGWEAYIRGLNKLQGLQIKTKDYNGFLNAFGRDDEYKSLFDLAPELWGGDINGEFNVEAAKELLETNEKITGENRRQIEEAIELKEAYDEALQSAKDYISDITGNLAESAAQAVENSILNGTDAWDEFEQAGLEAIAAIGRQMVMNKMLETYFSKYEDDMLKALESDDPEEVAAGLAGILGQAIQGMPAILDAMGMTLEQFYAQMEQYGIDMDALSESQRQAAQKGIAAASQDSIDELNGRFTAIQGHTYQINEKVKIILGYAGQQVSILSQIEENTRSLREIKTNIGRMQSDVGSMSLRGVPIQKL